MESFRSFRGPIFRKPVSNWSGPFFAVSYSKPALVSFKFYNAENCVPFALAGNGIQFHSCFFLHEKKFEAWSSVSLWEFVNIYSHEMILLLQFVITYVSIYMVNKLPSQITTSQNKIRVFEGAYLI